VIRHLQAGRAADRETLIDALRQLRQLLQAVNGRQGFENLLQRVRNENVPLEVVELLEGLQAEIERQERDEANAPQRPPEAHVPYQDDPFDHSSPR
jgi:hypothetical protein